MRKQLMQTFLLTLLVSSTATSTLAAEKVWKQMNNPANYVAIEKIKDADAEELILNHPYTIEPKKIVDMLLSVRYNKALLFRKDLKDQQVFFDVDLIEKKFAGPIAEALQKAQPNEVVVVSMVQKDPIVIIRNDRLNVFRLFVAQDGLHIKFIKTDAKLTGDYQARTTGNRVTEAAKGLRISLEPQEGQKLSFADAQELILDLNYNFAAQVDKKTEEEENQKQEDKKRVKRDDSTATNVVPPATKTPAAKTTAVAPATPEVKKAPADRLKDLKDLKDKGLITASEYETKKKEILKDL